MTPFFSTATFAESSTKGKNLRFENSLAETNVSTLNTTDLTNLANDMRTDSSPSTTKTVCQNLLLVKLRLKNIMPVKVNISK